MEFTFLTNRDGDINFLPDDHFLEFGRPVEEWATTANKKELWRRAKDFYLASNRINDEYHNLDNLRHPVHVVENYIPSCEDGDGEVLLYFIFKFINNGNTFRLRTRHDQLRLYLLQGSGDDVEQPF